MKKTDTRTIYAKKIMLVKTLVDELNPEESATHVSEEHVVSEGLKLGLTPEMSKLAWKNISQSGKEVDLRVKNEAYRGVPQFGKRKVKGAKTNKNITSKKAGALLKKAMRSRMPIGEFCLNNKISIKQYYDWIRELNVSGTLLDRQVLDPTRYAKLDVKLAIWMKKYPNTTRKEIRNFKPTERSAYERLIKVLVKYL